MEIVILTVTAKVIYFVVKELTLNRFLESQILARKIHTEMVTIAMILTSKFTQQSLHIMMFGKNMIITT